MRLIQGRGKENKWNYDNIWETCRDPIKLGDTKRGNRLSYCWALLCNMAETPPDARRCNTEIGYIRVFTFSYMVPE